MGDEDTQPTTASDRTGNGTHTPNVTQDCINVHFNQPFCREKEKSKDEQKEKFSTWISNMYVFFVNTLFQAHKREETLKEKVKENRLQMKQQPFRGRWKTRSWKQGNDKPLTPSLPPGFSVIFLSCPLRSPRASGPNTCIKRL